MKVITIANQKGGVGKTTTAMNVGRALAEDGKRVCLIDSDPQGNLTSYLGVRPGEPPYEELRTLDEMYLAKREPTAAEAKQYVTWTAEEVGLIASDPALAGVEYYLFSRPEREQTLARFVRHLAPDYDVVLIDTPPSLNLLTLNAFCASDSVLIPLQAEFFSLEGLIKMRETIADVQARWNPKLKILGALPTQITPRRKLTQEVLDVLGAQVGDVLLSQSIHDRATVAESSGQAMSVLRYDSKSGSAAEYRAVARELWTRIADRTEDRTETKSL